MELVAELTGFTKLVRPSIAIRAGLNLTVDLTLTVGQINETIEVAGMRAYIGASIGVVLSAELDCRYTDLLRKADLALYKAKSEGRGIWHAAVGGEPYQRVLQIVKQARPGRVSRVLPRHQHVIDAGQAMLGQELAGGFPQPPFGPVAGHRPAHFPARRKAHPDRPGPMIQNRPGAAPDRGPRRARPSPEASPSTRP